MAFGSHTRGRAAPKRGIRNEKCAEKVHHSTAVYIGAGITIETRVRIIIVLFHSCLAGQRACAHDVVCVMCVRLIFECLDEIYGLIKQLLFYFAAGDWSRTEKDRFWNRNPLIIGNRNLTETLVSIKLKTRTPPEPLLKLF